MVLAESLYIIASRYAVMSAVKFNTMQKSMDWEIRCSNQGDEYRRGQYGGRGAGQVNKYQRLIQERVVWSWTGQ